MKNTLLIMLLAFAFTTYAQDKYLYTSFNNLIEVEGTAYVIANVKHWSKADNAKNRYLLFIDTKTGQTNQVISLEMVTLIRLNKLKSIAWD